jgi:hypothetical protein
VKRSGRHEPIWVVIHICMETTQGLSLYSYLYLELWKYHVFLIIFYVFFFYKIREQEGGTGSAWRWGVGEVVQIICTHVSKCKNDTCWEYSGNQGRGMKESSQGGEFKYDIFFKNTLWHKGLDDLEVPHSWHSCSNIPKMPTYIFYWKRQLYFYRFVQLNALQLEKHLVWHFL